MKDQSAYTFNLDAVRDKNVKYPNQKKNGVLRCNPAGKNPSDVWTIPKVTSGFQRSSKERTAHPAQFPVAVIDRIIKACSNTAALILDPFLGSGTTAEVALRTGRYVVGFEINKAYCDIISSERLSHVVAELEVTSSQTILPFTIIRSRLKNNETNHKKQADNSEEEEEQEEKNKRTSSTTDHKGKKKIGEVESRKKCKRNNN